MDAACSPPAEYVETQNARIQEARKRLKRQRALARQQAEDLRLEVRTVKLCHPLVVVAMLHCMQGLLCFARDHCAELSCSLPIPDFPSVRCYSIAFPRESRNFQSQTRPPTKWLQSPIWKAYGHNRQS